MLSKAIIRLLFAVLPSTLPCAAVAQVRTDIQAMTDSALEFAGCYEIRWEKDTPTSFARSVPSHVWLSAVQLAMDSGQTGPAFVMRPAPSYRQSEYTDERWGLSGNRLILSWSTGFQGLQVVADARAREGATVWRGRTSWWTDEVEIVRPGDPPKPRPSGSAILRQVDC